ncbi:MAG: zinc ribbon domain-containing protein [Acidobacteriota bacterium]|nr:MAG: zinc ribbon domain-containing protein [Acidobacteriota bacterium]
MFCPTCGRDNTIGRKFCVACGTNLEAVSQALTRSQTDIFTRTDLALDQFIGRYAEHLFRNAGDESERPSVARSWKILGQGVLTTFWDFLIASLMWNILPFRFLILLISSPFRLVIERSEKSKNYVPPLRELSPNEEARQLPGDTAPQLPASVSEETTRQLEEYRVKERS